MNTISNQTAAINEEQCCIDSCTKSYVTEEETIVNSYKCNSRPLAPSDVWKIRKQRKQQTIRSFSTSVMN